MPPMAEYMEEVAALWDSHWLTNMGAEHKKLEQGLRITSASTTSPCSATATSRSSARSRPWGCRRAPRSSPPRSRSPATVHAISRVGLVPVFADVKPGDYTIDPESIEHLVTPRTSAIVPVHVYGNLCDVDAIQRVADTHGLQGGLLRRRTPLACAGRGLRCIVR